MPRIQVGKVAPGMVLSEAIVDKTGKVLIDIGTVLTDKHIRVLKTWGVGEVPIDSNQPTTDSLKPTVTDREGRIRKAAEKVRPRFGLNNIDHPVMKEIYLQCVLKAADELGPS